MSAETSVSLPKELADATLDRLVKGLELAETKGPEGPYMTLRSPAAPAPVGWVRLFSGPRTPRAVNVGLVVPFLGLDSHMIFAFTEEASAIPHFTLDAVKAGEMHAFHLDLVPRVDLGANLAHLDAVFDPLTPTFEAAKGIAGLTPAKISPRQHAFMSPWMLVHRATAEAFAAIRGSVDAYLDHWLGLVARGLPPKATYGLTGEALAERDRRNRAALFDPAVDPVWNQVERLLGPQVSLRIRELLRGAPLP